MNVKDGFVGLYWTILSLSIFYCIGEVILTLTSMVPLGAPNITGPAIGLLIIAFGTGGNFYFIKIDFKNEIIQLFYYFFKRY
jgi:dipeptide/tripeptide permease